ncbi:hypothetical protein GLOIN_2v1881255 [Rhizophagus clarus]|uniref:TLDc domain-containing protein n=1 Tax=Rhizophagus clarus TaxID=94130 RepID=A0A8H3LWF4_9GLOM|nr:hypothetical protein GLOIN_2v1881255 [Rhizophagus clarus]
MSGIIKKGDQNNTILCQGYTEALDVAYYDTTIEVGSRNGFIPKKFHKFCDDIPHTVALIKAKGTEEILGGFYPTVWRFSSWGKTNDSFISSFKNTWTIFGDDIIVYSSGDEDKDYDNMWFRKNIMKKS